MTTPYVVMRQIRQNIKALIEIPANEQCLGHFQIAVQETLLDLLDEVEKLQNAVDA